MKLKRLIPGLHHSRSEWCVRRAVQKASKYNTLLVTDMLEPAKLDRLVKDELCKLGLRSGDIRLSVDNIKGVRMCPHELDSNKFTHVILDSRFHELTPIHHGLITTAENVVYTVETMS
jgi:hypothetical protein